MNIMEELLKQALMSEGMPEKYQDNGEALRDLKAFLERKNISFEVGDQIERNELGRKRYKFPGDGQVALCVEIYDEPKMDADDCDLNNILMAVAVAKGIFRYYEVNGKYYRKVGANTTNIFDFKKK